MSEAEDRLRGWLERRADNAPRGQFMLDRVQRESARRTRRRRVTLGGLALATAVSILGVVAVIGPSTPPPPAASTTKTAFIAGARVRAAFPLGMPATRGESPPVVTLVAGHPTLVLSWMAPPALVTITAGTGPPPADAKPVKVGTVSATMAWNGTRRTDDFTIWWNPPTGGWATIAAPSEFPLSVIAKIISGMRPGSVPGAEPLTFATVPRGFVADNIDSTHVTFCPPGTAPSAATTGKILVRLEKGLLAGAGQHVTVAGRPGLLTATDAGTVLRVDVGINETLLVQVPSAAHVTRPDLLRFAAGIHPAGP